MTPHHHRNHHATFHQFAPAAATTRRPRPNRDHAARLAESALMWTGTALLALAAMALAANATSRPTGPTDHTTTTAAHAPPPARG